MVHGLPIRPVFNTRLGPKYKLRKKLGLDRHLPAVLLVGEVHNLRLAHASLGQHFCPVADRP